MVIEHALLYLKGFTLNDKGRLVLNFIALNSLKFNFTLTLIILCVFSECFYLIFSEPDYFRV